MKNAPYLKGGHNKSSGPLEDFLVRPLRMLCLDLAGDHVVVAEKDDADGQDGRILVGSGISQHWTK